MTNKERKVKELESLASYWAGAALSHRRVMSRKGATRWGRSQMRKCQDKCAYYAAQLVTLG